VRVVELALEAPHPCVALTRAYSVPAEEVGIWAAVRAVVVLYTSGLNAELSDTSSV
jgi:hypothetical protein